MKALISIVALILIAWGVWWFFTRDNDPLDNISDRVEENSGYDNSNNSLTEFESKG